MKFRKILAVVCSLALMGALLAGCNGGGGGGAASGSTPAASGSAAGGDSTPAGGGGSGGDTIKIGIIVPMTGVLAGFGEGSPWTENYLLDYINNEVGGIEVDGATKKVEFIIKDSESDVTKCTTYTQQLIEEDKVDLIVAYHTPETVNPVSAVCERYEQPAVCTDGPVDAWLAAAPEGGYQWAFHSHWDLATVYGCFKSLWETAGFAAGSGTPIGMFFANDADGTAWHEVFATNIPADGYTLVDPGMFPANTQDFSEIIQKFKDGNVEILCGTATNPDFSNLWRQCKQQGFNPKFVTMGKAYLLKSDAEAIGPELMDGLTSEIWWSKTHPWKSDLTGETPADFAKAYEDANPGREVTTPMGAKYYALEIAFDALKRAGTTEKVALRDAIAATDLETMFGHVTYESDHAWRSSLTGGQWINEDGNLVNYVVDNTLFPEIPTTGELQPMDQ